MNPLTREEMDAAAQSILGPNGQLWEDRYGRWVVGFRRPWWKKLLSFGGVFDETFGVSTDSPEEALVAAERRVKYNRLVEEVKGKTLASDTQTIRSWLGQEDK